MPTDTQYKIAKMIINQVTELVRDGDWNLQEMALAISKHMTENDITDVVRCKNCAHAYYNSSNDTYRCDRHGLYTISVKADDYCSFGD